MALLVFLHELCTFTYRYTPRKNIIEPYVFFVEFQPKMSSDKKNFERNKNQILCIPLTLEELVILKHILYIHTLLANAPRFHTKSSRPLWTLLRPITDLARGKRLFMCIRSVRSCAHGYISNNPNNQNPLLRRLLSYPWDSHDYASTAGTQVDRA